MNKLKKMALRVSADISFLILKYIEVVMHFFICPCLYVIDKSLLEEEISGFKEIFKMLDTDNSGHITLEELKTGLQRVGATLMDSEIVALMQAVSIPR
jgi:hypothetical protein